MMNAIYSSINLYAQLTIVAENHPKQTSPSFSAGAILFRLTPRAERKKLCFFSTECRIYFEIGTKFKNLLTWRQRKLRLQFFLAKF